MLTGVKISKRTSSQTQEEFKDDVCSEFNEFLEEFVIEGGVYYEMYETLVIAESPDDKKRVDNFKNKIIAFAAHKIDKVIDMARQKQECPIVDNAYYRGLYRKLDASDKSLAIKKQITDEFYLGLNTLIIQIEDYYDKYFPDNPRSCVKILRKTADMTQEKFKENVCDELNAFVGEFFVDNGAYIDMYTAMLDYAQEKDDTVFGPKIYNFCNAQVKEIVEIAKKENEVTCPNLAFFRVLYRKFQSSKKSSSVMKELIEEFLDAINKLTLQINAAHDEMVAGDDFSFVKILKKTGDMTREEYVKKVKFEYEEFAREFMFENSPYAELYHAMLDISTRRGEHVKNIFLNKYEIIKAKVNNVIEMSQKRDEVPCPNSVFYRALYNKFQNSGKSIDTILRLTDKFMESFDDWAFQIDWYYNKAFPVQSDDGVKFLKKEKLSTREFKDDVLREYNRFLLEFILDGGQYLELYDAMLNDAKQKGTESEFNKKIGSFIRVDLNEILKLVSRKKELPIPDYSYFLSIYYEYKTSSKSAKALEKASNKFLTAIDELGKKRLSSE